MLAQLVRRLLDRLAERVNVEWRFSDLTDVPFPGDEDD